MSDDIKAALETLGALVRACGLKENTEALSTVREWMADMQSGVEDTRAIMREVAQQDTGAVREMLFLFAGLLPGEDSGEGEK